MHVIYTRPNYQLISINKNRLIKLLYIFALWKSVTENHLFMPRLKKLKKLLASLSSSGRLFQREAPPLKQAEKKYIIQSYLVSLVYFSRGKCHRLNKLRNKHIIQSYLVPLVIQHRFEAVC